MIGAGEAATYGADGPGYQQNADEFFRAPVLSEVAPGDLQREVAPIEDTGYVAGLLRVEVQVVGDAREGERDVGAVDEGDGVHHQGDGDDAEPALGDLIVGGS